MGWVTICRDYPADVDRREVYSALNYQILHSTWDEGGHALDGITWLWDSAPLANEYKAKDFLVKRLFAGNRTGTSGIAVRYLQAPVQMESKTLKDLQTKRAVAAAHLLKLDREIYPASLSTTFFSCKACGSRINREQFLNQRAININVCPVCGKDLRPATVLKRIERAQAAVDKLNEKITAEQNRVNQKHGEFRWLVMAKYQKQVVIGECYGESDKQYPESY